MILLSEVSPFTRDGYSCNLLVFSYMVLFFFSRDHCMSYPTISTVVIVTTVHMLVSVVQMVMHAVAMAPVVVLVGARVVCLASMVGVSRVLHPVSLATADCWKEPEVSEGRPHSTKLESTE